MKLDAKQKSFLKIIIPLTAFVGGLCCFTPVVLVLIGVGTVAWGASLSDLLYGSYKWAFRGVALLMLAIALIWYFYKQEKVCTIDEAKKKRTRIINMVLITLISAILIYIIWLYVIVELIGKVIGLW